MPALDLTKSYVAYLDIIGYKTLLDEAVNNGTEAQTVEWILEAVKSAQKACEGWIKCKSIQVFSDCVLLTVPDSPEAVPGVLYYAAHVTGRLAYHNLWVKGAIAYGLHISKESVLFSPALVTAYGMEQSEAFHPRVLIHDDIVKHCRESGSDGRDKESLCGIWRDNDGRRYLNYLGLTAGGDPHHPESKDLLSKHRENLVRQLWANRNTPRFAAKYHWLAAYHNRFCHECLPPEEGERYLIR